MVVLASANDSLALFSPSKVLALLLEQQLLSRDASQQLTLSIGMHIHAGQPVPEGGASQGGWVS
jgi:hypothetical protein